MWWWTTGDHGGCGKNFHRRGVHGNVTTEQAREKAVQFSLEISAGQDPTADKPEAQAIPTVSALANEYLELHAKVNKRPKSLKEDQRMIADTIVPHFGHLRVDEVTSRDLQTLHKNLQSTPYAANRVRSLLTKMFSLAKEWGWRTDNPAATVTRYQEHKRTRFLSKEELARLWQTLDAYPVHITAYVLKFLILTGARRGEALNATWEQIDLDTAIWTKPSHLTKQKKTERLPLSEEAVALLKHVKTLKTSPYIFPGKSGDAPLQEIKKFWATVIKKAGLEDVRIHDLRHTYASHLVSQGLSLSIIGKLLGHTQAATTQRYAHLQDEPLRAATALFGKQVAEMVVEKRGDIPH